MMVGGTITFEKDIDESVNAYFAYAKGAEATAIELEEGEPLEFECRHFLECIAKIVRPKPLWE